MSEFGQVVPQGAANATKLIAIIEDPECDLPADAIPTFKVLVAALAQLEAEIGKLDTDIARRAKENELARRLMTVPGIGPLIGKRTWGGVIGINGHGPVIDGGDVFVPQYSTNGPDGAYIIEGYGVAPDIEVENDPVKVAAGGDPQLERAIQEVVSRRARIKGPLLPKRPADPVKNNTPK